MAVPYPGRREVGRLDCTERRASLADFIVGPFGIIEGVDDAVVPLLGYPPYGRIGVGVRRRVPVFG